MNRFTLRPVSNGWELYDRRDPAPVFHLPTREAAIKAAREYLLGHEGLLTVLRADGTVEEQWYRARENSQGYL